MKKLPITIEKDSEGYLVRVQRAKGAHVIISYHGRLALAVQAARQLSDIFISVFNQDSEILGRGLTKLQLKQWELRE